jgi:hypothetical protein
MSCDGPPNTTSDTKHDNDTTPDEYWGRQIVASQIEGEVGSCEDRDDHENDNSEYLGLLDDLTLYRQTADYMRTHGGLTNDDMVILRANENFDISGEPRDARAAGVSTCSWTDTGDDHDNKLDTADKIQTYKGPPDDVVDTPTTPLTDLQTDHDTRAPTSWNLDKAVHAVARHGRQRITEDDISQHPQPVIDNAARAPMDDDGPGPQPHDTWDEHLLLPAMQEKVGENTWPDEAGATPAWAGDAPEWGDDAPEVTPPDNNRIQPSPFTTEKPTFKATTHENHSTILIRRLARTSQPAIDTWYHNQQFKKPWATQMTETTSTTTTRAIRPPISPALIRRLCYTYADAFVQSMADLRPTTLIEHRIPLKEGSQPKRPRAWKYKPDDRKYSTMIFPAMEAAGIITAGDSQWRANTMFRPKAPGRPPRVVHDFRPVNAATEDSAYGMHAMD